MMVKSVIPVIYPNIGTHKSLSVWTVQMDYTSMSQLRHVLAAPGGLSLIIKNISAFLVLRDHFSIMEHASSVIQPNFSTQQQPLVNLVLHKLLLIP